MKEENAARQNFVPLDMPREKRHAQAHTMRSSGHVPVEAIWDGQMIRLFATIHRSIALINT